MEPLPTTLRPVSGKVSARGIRKTTARMVKNQKSHRQPRRWVKIPPTTGAIAGAAIGSN